METLIRVMLSVFLVGLIVMTIVFFSIFGLLPAEKLTQVLQGSDSTSTQPTVIVSTTTVVERIIERTSGGDDRDDQQQDQVQQPDQPADDDTGDQQPQQPQPPDDDGGDETGQTGPTEQDLPPAVFNTSGAITQIGSDFLRVDSDASHMEVIPSSGIVPVTIQITDSTNLLDEDNNSINLSDFSVGQEISIEAPSNIKNQTEFEASNIRITE